MLPSLIVSLAIAGGVIALPPRGEYDATAIVNPTPSADPNYRNCHEVEELVFVDRCETYNARECLTNQTVSCIKEEIDSCRPVTVPDPRDKCFNATTKHCFYEETVDYEIIDAYLPKQICYADKVPVCNTVYKIINETATREVCTTVPKSYCSKETKVVEDKACSTETKIDCTGTYADKYDGKYGVGGVGGKSFCRKKLETKCHTYPRTVTMDNCYTTNERSCEYINESAPKVVYEDDCREYEKRYCKIEQRPQKKQIKKYVYHLRCEPKYHQTCITVDNKKVETHCEPSKHYGKCHVVPHEKCNDVPKQTCYKEPVHVKRTKCDGYRSDSSSTKSDY